MPSCVIMCDTLRSDDELSDVCIHCDAVYPRARAEILQSEALASNGGPADRKDSRELAEGSNRGGSQGTGQGRSCVLGPRRPPFAVPQSRGVIARSIQGVQFTPDRRGASWHVASGKVLARYLRPLYARRARLDAADAAAREEERP